MKLSCKIIVLCLLLVGSFGVQAQLATKNDVGYITACNPHSVTVDILGNDQNVCASPIVKIVDYNENLASVSITGSNELKYEISCFFDKKVTDSLRYSVECGGVLDTATVHIIIDQQSLTSGTDFINSFDKNCLIEGEEITHTSIVRNNCSVAQMLSIGLEFTNPGVMALHEKAQITIAGTATDIDHINNSEGQLINFTLGANSEIRFETKYHVTQITTGRYETTFAELGGFNFNKLEKVYIPACPDKKLIITSCDLVVPTVDVSTLHSTSYSIERQPDNGSATIDANGIFRYTRPAAISGVINDYVLYKATGGGVYAVHGRIDLKLLPCIDDLQFTFTMNTLCRQDSCEYTGSGPAVLINEVMITPKDKNGAIYGTMMHNSSEDIGGEWIELYNANHCDAVDISGYVLGNASADQVVPGSPNSLERNLGAGFVIPQGTVIPPMGFCVIRSQNATPVDSYRLTKNSGNTVEVVIDNHLGNLHLNNGGTRFWLPDNGSWIALYDQKGMPQDALYWGASSEDICADCSPGTISGVNLSSLDNIPANRKMHVLNFEIDVITQSGNSVRRVPDGGNWKIGELAQPTIGYCNEMCNLRFPNSCDGTATVTAFGGSGNFSYLWNDSQAQTTATAIGLCEGTYCVTITDNETKLQRIACILVEDSPVCHQMDLNPDYVTLSSCVETETLIDILANDVFFCDAPDVEIVKAPLEWGASASIVNNKLLYTFLEGSTDFTDEVVYQVSCNGMTRRATVYVTYRLNIPRIVNVRVSNTTGEVNFSVEGGASPFVFLLNDDEATATSVPVFRNVPEGEHTLSVTDKNHCSSSATFKLIPQCPEIVPDLYFTPNGDGIKDVWTVTHLDCYEFYTLDIYDRHGRLMKRYESNFDGWDGKYNGEPQPSTDYWYRIQLEEAEGVFVGHFTLIR